MKAKELREKALHPSFVGDTEEKITLYVFTEEEMAIFWSQLCKEQRELCAKQYFSNVISTHYYKPTFDALKNTPEPTFD